jgi:hypothetical protein
MQYEQDAPVDGLETVAHVGQGAAYNYAHRVIQERGFHFLLDGNRSDVFVRSHCGPI